MTIETLPFIMIVGGILLAFLVYLFLTILLMKILSENLKRYSSLFVKIANPLVKPVSLVISASIFIFFLFYSIEMFNIPLLNSLISNIVKLLPKAMIILLMLLIVFVVLQLLRKLILRLNLSYGKFAVLFLEVVVYFAAILTIFEYIGVPATPFLEIFRVILYTVGLTIAISIGIALGFSIQGSVKRFIYKRGKGKSRLRNGARR